MNKHPLLRAYLAGIAIPTVFLLVVMADYTLVRYVYDVPIPVERVIVFPMAFVPNAWGLWNLLHTAFFSRRFSLGVFLLLTSLVTGSAGLFRRAFAGISDPPSCDRSLASHFVHRDSCLLP